MITWSACIYCNKAGIPILPSIIVSSFFPTLIFVLSLPPPSQLICLLSLSTLTLLCTLILSLSLILRTHCSPSLTQTIRAVQPDVVVVELCQYRVSMLKMDENTLLREAKDINLDKVQQAIKQVRL